MAWAGSTRRSRLPRNWAQLREQTRRAAGDQCEWIMPDGRCPSAGTDCDHIIPGDDHSDANRQWLCRQHHKEKTESESAPLRWADRPTRKRPAEKHPGAI